MKRTIRVFAGDQPRLLGAIRYEAQGLRESATFQYDADWLAAPDCRAGRSRGVRSA